MRINQREEINFREDLDKGKEVFAILNHKPENKLLAEWVEQYFGTWLGRQTSRNKRNKGIKNLLYWWLTRIYLSNYRRALKKFCITYTSHLQLKTISILAISKAVLSTYEVWFFFLCWCEQKIKRLFDLCMYLSYEKEKIQTGRQNGWMDGCMAG